MIKDYKYIFKSISISPRLKIKLKDFAELVSITSGIKISESFIIRQALDDLFAKEDATDYIINKKIEIEQERVNI